MVAHISQMTDDDVESARALWADTEGVGQNESDTPNRLKDYLKRNPGLSRVVRDGERIVGAVLCGHDGRRGYLFHLAVRPEYRKRGLGQQLVEACLESLNDIGILHCNIFVFSGNELGKQFWKRSGWSDRSDLQILQRSTAI
jgi:N-acetylglutamate synthase